MMRRRRQSLRGLIEEHYRRTKSKLAKRMLGDWGVYVPQFLKVTPV